MLKTRKLHLDNQQEFNSVFKFINLTEKQTSFEESSLEKYGPAWERRQKRFERLNLKRRKLNLVIFD
jgi:hypothetical protein